MHIFLRDTFFFQLSTNFDSAVPQDAPSSSQHTMISLAYGNKHFLASLLLELSNQLDSASVKQFIHLCCVSPTMLSHDRSVAVK